MKRRDFLALGAAGVAGGLAGVRLAPGQPHDHEHQVPPPGSPPATGPGTGADAPPPPNAFRRRFAPQFNMFPETSPRDAADRVKWFYDHGFIAIEDARFLSRPEDERIRMCDEMHRLGIQFGAFLANPRSAFRPTFVLGDPVIKQRVLEELRETIIIARRAHARYVSLVPGLFAHELDPAIQTANVVELLRGLAAECMDDPLILCLAPLNPFKDHPGVFLTSVAQAQLICKAVLHGCCKILYDTYHQQMTAGNLIGSMERAWENISYVKFADAPRRREPGSGEINFSTILKHLDKEAYAGIIGLDHALTRPSPESERAVLQLYRALDDGKSFSISSVAR